MPHTILFHNQKRMSTVKHLIVDYVIILKKHFHNMKQGTMANVNTQISYSLSPNRKCEFKLQEEKEKNWAHKSLKVD